MPEKRPSSHPSGDDHGIITADGKPFAIPEKGSIGLLALGYRGLMAWRAERIRLEQERAKQGDGEKGAAEP